jgi:hypothetical protein
MLCAKCGRQDGEGVRFCRHCGADRKTLTSGELRLIQRNDSGLHLKDPDELTSNGIGSVIMGDGFFMVAVILSATQSPISSLLWLFLLIPAFFFFGKGFADVLYARQIRRAEQRRELNEHEVAASSLIDTFRKSISRELPIVGNVTERTTRELT